MSNEKIILNDEQSDAVEQMLSGCNVALLGPGGTGKSVVVRSFAERCNRNVVKLAPTGLAARNLGEAATIHSFFELDIMTQAFPYESVSLARKLARVDTIIIDEISMVRSDILASIDRALRFYLNSDQPFGGKQIIVVGDFYQLPPIVSNDNLRRYLEYSFSGEYAFCPELWNEADFKRITLTQVMRQQDLKFIDILQSIRHPEDDVNEKLRLLNSRVSEVPENTLVLCCTNSDAEQINDTAMDKLSDYGVCFRGVIRGRFPARDLPAAICLQIKKDERIMLLANRSGCVDYDYVNGDFGTVLDYDERNSTVWAKIKGNTVAVKPAKWSNFDYFYDEETHELKVVEVGVFYQFPIAPAYAMTIHKAQGQTLERAHVSLGRGCFASGQLYTALSRVRSFDALTLDRPVKLSDLLVNARIEAFDQDNQCVSQKIESTAIK